MSRDPRIDAYIENAQDFARPVLRHLREVVHAAVPHAEEAIKWGMPHFLHRGKNLAGMAAFKAHCALTIHGEGRNGEFEGMGQIGKVTGLADLPPDADIAARLREAVARIDTVGTAAPRGGKAAARRDIDVPPDLAAALRENAAACASFEAFAPSQRREYLDWIYEAKRDETRNRRITQAVEWLAEGKKRNWRYER